MDLLTTIGYLLIGVFAIGFFVTVHRWFWGAYYGLRSEGDEIHYVDCDDGVRLEVARYRGKEGFDALPIILCHGIGANRFNMDLKPDRSLARTLNAMGFDVWNLELRGFGDYGRPRFLTRGNESWSILFEDFVDLDLPATIGLVMRVTGAAQVHWVGHSMGGMVGYAFAQGPGAPLLASLTTLAAPGRMRLPSSLKFVASLSWLFAFLPYVPLRTLSRLAAPFYASWPFSSFVIQADNMDTLTVRESLTNLVSDIPGSLMRQFAQWALIGEIRAAEDDRNFTTGLHLVTVPVLAIAGDGDVVAPPSAVRFAVEHVSSAKRAYINIGGEGAGAELPAYGHGDLLLGRDAATHVFGRVAAWICDIEGIDTGQMETLVTTEGFDAVGEQPETQSAPASVAIPAPPTMIDAEESVRPPLSVSTDFEDALSVDLAVPPLAGYETETRPDDAGDPMAHGPETQGDAPAEPAEVVVEERRRADRRETEVPIKLERRVLRERRRHGLRRAGERPPRRGVPLGWTEGASQQEEGLGRQRPPRLHRSPVSGDALTEALKLAATRADRVLETSPRETSDPAAAHEAADSDEPQAVAETLEEVVER